MTAHPDRRATAIPPTHLDHGRRVRAPVHNTAFWLSGALLLITDIASGPTAFGHDVLTGPAAMTGSARGTALVLLFVATPVIAVAMFLSSRGSVRAAVVWLGALGACAYNSQMLLYATPVNQLFLLYVAMLGLSAWAIGALLCHQLAEAVAARVLPGLPARAIAIYVWTVAALNTAAWLRVIVPATLAGEPTSILTGTGLTTNPVYIQDLALWLPLAAVAACWLWRHRPWGYLLIGATLTLWIIESISIAVDQWFGADADPTSPVASQAMTPIFAAVALIGIVPLIAYLRRIQSGAVGSPETAHHPASTGAPAA